MIEKVLIAEDHEIANLSVQKTLEELAIKDLDYVYYCDEALEKIQKAKANEQPYDLLITDLYFEQDYRKQRIVDGETLITAVREIQPELKVMVFSAENRAMVIERLFNTRNIDGYVRKARNDAKELKTAIHAIAGNQRYFPRHLVQLIKQNNAYGFKEFDITIISLLASGIRQKDIPAWLQKNHITPSKLSSVEKCLKHMREALNFSNNEQLIAHCKDIGLV